MERSASEPPSKTCRKCGETKPYVQFALKPSGRRSSPCMACRNKHTQERLRNSPAARERQYQRNRVAARKRKYGLNEEQVAALLGAGCQICGEKAEHIDHDHRTGKVRGGLCGPCNRGLAMYADQPERLRAAAAYLEAHRERTA